VELKKVSWPDRRQLIEATRTIIIVVLAIAFLIFLMDAFFQAVLVQFIPSLFK
jgi:preprotein translocase SecE subunit